MLSEEQLMRAVQDAADHDAVLLHFSGGGEPLINQFTLPAMRKAKERALSVALSTNGALLSKEVAESVDYIRVSLNAGTKKQHDKTNHPHDHHSDWHKILDNISEAVRHKRKDIGLAYVVDQYNWGDIPEFCRVASMLGVDFVHIRPAFWYDAEKDVELRNLMPAIADACEMAKATYGKYLDIFAINQSFDGYWTQRSYDRCLAVLTGICLTATGDFAVCQDRVDLRFGKDYAEGKASFAQTWWSKEHLDLVNSITAPGVLDKCPRCVWNKRNEIIHNVFVSDEMRLDLI